MRELQQQMRDALADIAEDYKSPRESWTTLSNCDAGLDGYKGKAYPLYLDPPSESDAVALLREIVSRFDAAYPIPLVVGAQLKNKIDEILKGQL